MNYQEILKSARDQMGPFCKSCLVCNGKVCGNTMPGPGAKGSGTVFIRNYQKWQEILLNLDAIHENKEPDTAFSVFGQDFALPVFAAPIGAMKLHYGDKYDDLAYNDLLLPSAIDAGIAAFTGDGVNPAIMQGAAQTLKKYQGKGIPTIKPWGMELVREKLAMVEAAQPMAIAMDIDAAGLPFLKGQTPPAGSKTVDELHQIVAWAKRPFILKGIMTASGAKKAVEAGVSAIVVSNHGGRVLDHCPGTAEVLPEIVQAVGGQVKIFVDGGIRTGQDVFKALALGADAVLIGRPFVNMIYGAGAEGVRVYVEKLASELADTMTMCGASSLAEIKRDMVRV
jgi:methylmalonyl-CoA mutase cobalamin-binding subunit